MSTIKLAYSSVTSMTVAALNSLASSPTAGWQSDVIDNTSDLYEDILVQVILDFDAGAPANDKKFYLLVGSGQETTYTEPFTGTQGSCTFTSWATTAFNPKLLAALAYETSGMVINSNLFSVASAFGGSLPPKIVLGGINYTGAAVVASGNSVKWRGVYRTVA
jgi:hypothetical protein